MKAFVAYRFTGEDPKELEPLLTVVRDGLLANQVDSYCTFFDEAEFKNKNLSARQIMDHAFKIINESDFLFVVQTSEGKSEGMLMEVGYCFAKGIPVVVANRKGVKNTYLPQMAALAFEWENAQDLEEKIKTADLKSIKN